MPKKRHGGLRKFNRTFFNPVIKLFAGRFFYSLVYHMGRRSGKEYTTPVVGVRKDGFIFIPLPYGADTDWLLNVQARGACRVKMNGRLYASAEPEVVGPEAALAAFPPIFQRAFRRAKVSQYLRLRIE
jgi:deazaflavin-dependent oxidoreductase (nitroreductase family)